MLSRGPVFVRVMVWAALVVPTTVSGKVRLEGLMLTGPRDTVTVVEPQKVPVQAVTVVEPAATPKTTPLLLESLVTPLLLPESFVTVATVLSKELQIAETSVCVLPSPNVPVATRA